MEMLIVVGSVCLFVVLVLCVGVLRLGVMRVLGWIRARRMHAAAHRR
jgi:hypothetical protein